jgi:glucose-1-phosphate thymidylyltransferase
MQSLILAAGFATRLYPLTRNFPKPLLAVGGRSILDRLLADLDSLAEISRHIIITNHIFFNHFVDWQKSAPYRKELVLLDDGALDNARRRGAVNDILFALGELSLREDVMVLAGDNVVDFSFGDFVRFAAEKGTSCITCHHEPSIPALQKTGVLEMDARGRVQALHEKPQHPPSHWAAPPFYFYRAQDFGLLSQAVANGCSTDAPGSLAGWLCRQTAVHAWQLPGKRYDIGDLPSYEAVNALFSKA